jgi:hypothetical protein
MCNTVTMRYTCNHFVQFHRSTCRSVIWVTRATSKVRKAPKAPKSKASGKSKSPDRGRTLERSSSTSDASPSPSPSPSLSPLSTQSLSPAPKLVPRPACKSTSEILFHTQQRCGPCQRTSRSGLLRIRRTRSELPSRKKRKHLKRGRPVSGGSPLKHELTVEELLRADSETRKNVELAEKVGNLAVCSRRKSL